MIEYCRARNAEIPERKMVLREIQKRSEKEKIQK